MTPEAQRIAIAEACPTVFVRSVGATGWNYKRSDARVLPCIDGDPLHDLNAMHEAEKKLLLTYHRVNVPTNIATNEANLYRKNLLEICERDGDNHTIHATAAQRAEAFLRCRGLWRD